MRNARNNLSFLGVRSSCSFSNSFSQPVETRFTPVQAVGDRFNSEFKNMQFNLSTQVQVRYKEDSTLGMFSRALLQSEGNNVQKVEFYTITGQHVPLSEKVKDLNDFPIVC